MCFPRSVEMRCTHLKAKQSAGVCSVLLSSALDCLSEALHGLSKMHLHTFVKSSCASII